MIRSIDVNLSELIMISFFLQINFIIKNRNLTVVFSWFIRNGSKRVW